MIGHVLVVESDDRLRDGICTFLKRAGVATFSTNTAQGALVNLFRMPALIVLDLALPDENGIEILRFVRELGLPIAIAVIASVSDATTFRPQTDPRPDAIFGKPFDFKDFSDWLSHEFGGIRAFGGDARRGSKSHGTLARDS
jgi:DNA-binding response OmpR family regulator